jgi:hypothetical protein
MTVQTMHRNTPLSNAALQAYAPSIFATTPWQGMSSRYT